MSFELQGILGLAWTYKDHVWALYEQQFHSLGKARDRHIEASNQQPSLYQFNSLDHFDLTVNHMKEHYVIPPPFLILSSTPAVV